MHWYPNDPIGPKRAVQAAYDLRREPTSIVAQKMAGAVVCGFITEGEITRLTKVAAPELEAAIESYRRMRAERHVG